MPIRSANCELVHAAPFRRAEISPQTFYPNGYQD